jgi:hypothetical protein
MRAITSYLTNAQDDGHVHPGATLSIDGTAFTTDLVGYTYRESALADRITTVVLDNTDEGINTAGIARGDAVDIARGLYVSGTLYTAELPRVWVESMTWEKGYVFLHCIDVWGKLARVRLDTAQSWTGTAITTIVDWILTQAGLTRSGTLTASTMDFTIPRNQPLDTALKRIAARIPEYPYAGLDAAVKFKQLSTSESSAYTYGWNTNHPVRAVTYVTNAWRFNKVTVEGALKSDGTYYSASSTNGTQVTLVGTRERLVIDRSLTSTLACSTRAAAELNYYAARNTELSILALPCHGLEVYDVVTLATTPFGGANFTGRVASYVEHYQSGGARSNRYEQEIQVNAGAYSVPYIAPALADQPTDDALITGAIPAGYIDAETADIVTPAALSALGVTGAVALTTAAATAFTTRALLETEFYNVTGRPAEDGDALVAYDSGATGYRLYVRYSSSRWLYFDADGSITG